MSFLNEDFETEGALAGEAKNWDLAVDVHGFAVAQIGSVLGWPGVERFEYGHNNDTWSDDFDVTDRFVFGIDDQAEGFEHGFNNDNWTEDFIAIASAGVDDFETGWDNDTWQDEFGGGDLTTAGVDGFETGWDDTWQDEFGGGDLTNAEFDPGAKDVEDFETDWDLLPTV